MQARWPTINVSSNDPNLLPKRHSWFADFVAPKNKEGLNHADAESLHKIFGILGARL